MPRYFTTYLKGPEIVDDIYLNKAKNGQFDSRMEAETVGGVQLRNCRPFQAKPQEDRLITFELEENESKIYQEKSPEEKEKLLKETVEALSNIVKQAITDKTILDQGSTLAIAVLEKDQYTVVNLGDSEVIEVRIGQDTQSVRTVNQLHDLTADNPEFKRVGRETQIFPMDQRLNGTLAVSRSIGDIFYEPYGLSHIPQIDTQPYALNEGETVYIIVTSDGLKQKTYDRSNGKTFGLKNEGIADIVKEYRTKTLGTLSLALANEARHQKSNDDISILTTKITSEGRPAQVSVLGVFDGHGKKFGHQVSQFLKDHFKSFFLAFLKSKPLPEWGFEAPLSTPSKTYTPHAQASSSSSSQASSSNSLVPDFEQELDEKTDKLAL